MDCLLPCVCLLSVCRLAGVQVLHLLLIIGHKTLVRAQDPEAMLWSVIQNRIKMLTHPLPQKVQVGNVHGGCCLC